ncbi:glucose 1-dehydrogenase [Pseudoxanthobacter sp.]|uniref:SDR family NAD(P)-dependent oxidoreductase n=1 Tax=Pseudoxanthobacter sp. TaxID=1925742 RepID=UPI002FE3FD4D
MADRFSLCGKTALVTGASRGIGRAIAGALAQAGADVAVTARRRDDLDAVVAEITAAGVRAHAVAMDVQSVAACRAGVAEAAAHFGGIDVLFNNAGMEQVCPSLDVEEDLWDRIADTNLKGAFFCAQAAARTMRLDDRKSGSIVNLCSLTSFVGVATAAPYTASKSGLLGLTRALSTEWAPFGIRVNAIAPGYFRTALTDVFYRSDDWQQAMVARIPQGRFGTLDDLAGAAVFLASDASAYITGQCLAVDGGYLAAL